MRDFTMSMYRSKEDLYRDKAMYWESMFEALLRVQGDDRGFIANYQAKSDTVDWLEDLIKEEKGV